MAEISSVNGGALSGGADAAGGLSPRQVENLKILARDALGEDKGWLLWGPGQGSPKQPVWINDGGRVETGKWGEVANTHSGGEALGWVGKSPRGARAPVQGVGFLIGAARESNAVVLDIDHCFNAEGKASEFGQAVIDGFKGTYTEKSPSGKGLRVVLFAGAGGTGWPGKTGKVAVGACGGGEIELYEPANSKAKFFRLSGDRLEGAAPAVTEQAEALAWVVGLMLDAVGRTEGGGVAKGGDPAAAAAARGSDGAADESDGGAPADPWERLDWEAARRVPQGAWKPAKEAAQVIRALETMRGQGRGDVARVMRGELDAVCDGDDSRIDYFICCEAIRRGARTSEDVEDVWRATPAWRDEKAGGRKGYRGSTVKEALRRVSAEVLKWPLRRAGAGAGAGGDAEAAERGALLQGLMERAAEAGEALTLNDRGRMVATVANMLTVLRLDETVAGAVRFNEHAGRVERAIDWIAFDPRQGRELGPLEKVDWVAVQLWLERRWGLRCRLPDVGDGLSYLAQGNRVHPVRDRLDELAAGWDGKPRLDDWLVKYLKAAEVYEGQDISAYVREVGRKVLMAAVARAYTPGEKFDTVLTLIGEGGAGKSTVWRVLSDAVLPGLFTDSIADVGDRVRMAEVTKGTLIAELPECNALSRAEVTALKAAITAESDRWRRPYKDAAEDAPRGFILVGTANGLQFLPDSDLALRRRFWPVLVGGSQAEPFDTEALAQVAPQLWGEAVHRRRAGGQLHLDGKGEAQRGCDALLGGVADEAGPYADKLDWLYGQWERTRGAGMTGASSSPWGTPVPDEGCALGGIAGYLGLAGTGAVQGAAGQRLTRWLVAGGFQARRAHKSNRWFGPGAQACPMPRRKAEAAQAGEARGLKRRAAATPGELPLEGAWTH